MSQSVEQCEVCGSMKLAGEPCAECKRRQKQKSDKERFTLEWKRKQVGQQKHGRSGEDK